MMLIDYQNISVVPWKIQSFSELVEEYKNDSSVYFLVDTQVVTANANKFSDIPNERLFQLSNISEDNKTLAYVEEIITSFVEREVTRDSTLIAVGGGILTDIVGFVGAIYQRGIKNVIYVPTSLLAMIDAGLGGKTGVNFNKRKNFIGAFIEPSDIIIDITFLQTLPLREIKNSIGELIKYKYLGVKNLITSYDDIVTAINTDIFSLLPMIESCLMYKHNIVKDDFKENNIRKFLNLGHTFGHAFEGAGLEGHGRAVLHGILSELLFSITQTKNKELRKWCKKEAEIIDALTYKLFKDQHNNLNINKNDILRYIINDKKREQSYIEMPIFTSNSNSNKIWTVSLEKIQISSIESFINMEM